MNPFAPTPTATTQYIAQHWSDTNPQTLVNNSGALLITIILAIIVLVLFARLDKQTQKAFCWMFIIGTVIFVFVVMAGHGSLVSGIRP